ncbi:phosphotyrosine interaction domain-containing family member [Holotrichia oblita]|uniref:Phosphotyrosine interaction domain-containing family member n=1 Tax=Holotrichia oblita TaxID=644536 RepID=A0ACB9TLI0_HOLOL|nr:phosphotyrosine interaction domain-containing family member [Holotrichia oblita]
MDYFVDDLLSSDEDEDIAEVLQYERFRPAKGLWGIKHTRRPVDAMVNGAKTLPPNTILPIVRITITKDGLSFRSKHKSNEPPPQSFTVDVISYGVQDLIYTRVFSMIVVTSNEIKDGIVPFVCHAFVCDSKNQARQITYALAAAFQEYGKKIKEENKDNPTLAKKNLR